MKLTNPESIQESEKEFIDTINAELDWDAIEQMLLEKHGFAVQEEVLYKDGNLVVHENQIAYKFDFEIKVPLTVIFNRNGECLEIKTQNDEELDEADPGEDFGDDFGQDLDDESDTDNDPVPDEENEGSAPREELKRSNPMASEIADMISEINEQGE